MSARILALSLLIACAFLCGCTGLHQATMHPSEYVDNEGKLLFTEAQAAFDLGELEKASTLLDELTGGYPEYFRAHRLLQDMEVHSKGSRKAEELAVERCRANENPLTLTLWARVAADSEERIKLLKKALTLDESYVWAHYGLAHTYLKEGRVENFESARGLLQEALRFASDFHEARLLLIENLDRLGDYEEEAEQFATYLDARPDDLDQRYNFSVLLRGRLDDPEEALEQLDAILSQKPQRVDALLLKGAVLCQEGELSEAEGHFIEMSDQHPNALLNLGILYKDYLEQPDMAIEYFNRYLEYSGKLAEEKTFFDQKILVPNSLETLAGEME